MPNDINIVLQQLNARIADATHAGKRDLNEVTLLAVSKRQPITAIKDAYTLGIRKFGENYLQEALDKQAALHELDIEWHFIGHVQSNKTSKIAQHFSWLHTLDRKKIADKLNEQRPTHLAPLNCCIQVNTSSSTTKSGLSSFDDVAQLVKDIQHLPQLRLRGLMTIPSNNPAQAATEFAQLADDLAALQQQFPELPLDTLSMGMSNDLELAIKHGATIVRVGSALFGQRTTT